MSDKKVPHRQCIGCRESRPKKELIRIVKTKEGNIVLDRTGRQNGRGAYLCDKEECLRKARKSGALSRSYCMNVPENIYDELERQWNNDAD